MARTKTSYNVVLHKKDLRRDVFCSGGPGGQNQNKVASGVRYTHIPTGISAESRVSRDQPRNDAMALEKLKERLLSLYLLRRFGNARDAWIAKPEAVFGNQMRTYRLCGNTQNTVDHETGWECSTRSVLNGQIQDLLKTRMRMAAKEAAAWSNEGAKP